MKTPAASVAAALAILLATSAHAATGNVPEASSVSTSGPGLDVDRAGPRATLTGTIAFVDERNDVITVRTAANATADLRVRDGLLFNAVRYGDRVEVTVETIQGAATIVGLTKQ